LKHSASTTSFNKSITLITFSLFNHQSSRRNWDAQEWTGRQWTKTWTQQTWHCQRQRAGRRPQEWHCLMCSELEAWRTKD